MLIERRLSTVDFERATTDEFVLEARRSALADDFVVEYAVHGQFKMAADGSSFPDTYWFTLRELKDAGMSKAHIKAAVDAFEAKLSEANSGSTLAAAAGTLEVLLNLGINLGWGRYIGPRPSLPVRVEGTSGVT